MLRAIKKFNSMEWVESHPMAFTRFCIGTFIVGIGLGIFTTKKLRKRKS